MFHSLSLLLLQRLLFYYYIVIFINYVSERFVFVGKFRLLVLLCFALWSNSWSQVRFPLTVGREILYRMFHDLWTILQEMIF